MAIKLLLSAFVVSLTSTLCILFSIVGVSLLNVKAFIGEFISRKDRKGAKIAAPLLRCERREKYDDRITKCTRVRRKKRSIVAMEPG